MGKIKLAPKLISIFVLASLFMILYSVHALHAQEAERTFTISPPDVKTELDPGKQTEGKLKIINDGDSALTFKTSVQDFIVKDDIGTPYILPPDSLSNKYSAASWIAMYPDIVTVEPHQKVELSFFIQVPLDARPGGHYAAIMYTPTSTIGLKGTGAAVNTSVGTLFYVTVKGPVNIKASISKFFTKSLWDFGPVKINTSILNVSDLHITPAGTITVTNMLGQKSDAKSISQYNIFPGVARNYETSVGKKFMLGLYKASLNASYGPNKSALIATTSFVVFPWKIAIFIVLMVLAIWIGRKYWKRDKGTQAPPENHSTPESHYQ